MPKLKIFMQYAETVPVPSLLHKKWFEK